MSNTADILGEEEPDQQSWPVVFERKGSSRALGVVAYVLMIPILSFFLMLFITVPLHLLFTHLRVSTPLAGYFTLPALSISFVFLVWMARKEYRMRAGLKAVFNMDSVEIFQGNTSYLIEYQKISALRLGRNGLKEN